MATKLVTAVASIVVCVILVATVMIPTVQDGKGLFNKDVDYTFNNVGDQIAEGSLTEEYTMDWDSALPGMIKVNGDTPTVYFVAGEDATVNPTQKDVVVDLTYGELPTPTRTGYTFDGWYTSTEYTTEVTDTTIVVGTEDKILYAKWVGNTYTVTFDADGGTVSPATKTVTFGSAYGELPVPTYTGHIFGGWFDEDNNPIVAQSIVSIADDHTLTAVWTLEQYLVSFTTDGNGTVDVTEVLVDYGTSYTILNNTITIDGTTVTATASSGYVWDYWEPSTDGVVTGAMTFIAHFNNPPVTLSFETDGTTGATVSQASIADVPRGSTYVVADNTVTVTHGSTTLGTVTASLVDGYYFTGWSEAQGVGTVSDAMTFTAEYEVILVKQVSCNDYSTWIVTTDGKLFGCGYNSYGQQGDGTTTNVTTFTQRLSNETIASVDAGSSQSNTVWALTTDGKLFGCGNNNRGQQGDGTTTNVTTFTQRLSNETIASVSNGDSATWAITTDGKLFGCGYNSYGQQGDGTTTDVTTFTQRLSNETIASVSASGGTTWIVTTDGKLFGCGWNSEKQQGDGTTTNVTTFTQRLSTETIVSVNASGNTTWAITTDGKLFGCGSSNNGNQGNGSTSHNAVNTFTQRLTDETIASVSANGGATWAITTDGKLFGCGSNYYGQQGNGSSGSGTNVTTFTQRLSTETIASVIVGTWAITTDGKLFGCGNNQYGQQGNGSSGSGTNVTTFTQRLSTETIASVSTSSNATWAITTDGKLFGCGYNSYGQQGDGTTTNVTTFTQRPMGVISIQPVLSPQINPLSPIHLDPLHPFTPIPIQPMSIDYTAITGFDTWQMGGEDWMLATVTVGVDQYALALYYAGLTEPLVWDEDIHMVFDNGTLTVTNGGNTYTMTYKSLYFRGNGDFVLNTTGGYLKGDSQFLAYAVPTTDSGVLVTGTLSENDMVSIADGTITLDDVTITSSESGEYPGLFSMSAIAVQYDTDQTASASAIIMPKSVTVTVQQPDDMYGVLLDAVIIFVMVAILLAIVGMFVYTRS